MSYRFTSHGVVEIDGNPWFVVKDVLRAVGFYLKADGGVNTTMAIATLGTDEKVTKKIGGPGGLQQTYLISESGFYKLIMRAHKSNPETHKFQDWVTREVLPSIRKTGTYTMPGMEPKVARSALFATSSRAASPP